MAGSMSTEPSTASSASMLWGGVRMSVIARAYEFRDFLVALECLRPQLDDLFCGRRFTLLPAPILLLPPGRECFDLSGLRIMSGECALNHRRVAVKIDFEYLLKFCDQRGCRVCGGGVLSFFPPFFKIFNMMVRPPLFLTP